MKKPRFVCQECGKKFYSVKAAERAAFGNHGCPKCGGSDIDAYVEPNREVCPMCVGPHPCNQECK